MKWLVGQGCDINTQSDSGRTALWKSAQGGHREVLHYLLAMGASINAQHRVGTTVLFDCVRSSNLLQITTDLLEHGMDVHIRDIEGNSALHEASLSENAQAVILLLKVGLPVNCSNDHENTPLHTAAMQGHTSIVVILLNYGADINYKNSQGQSPLFLAMLHLQESAMCLLYILGARLRVEELEDYLAHHASKKSCKRDIFDKYQTLTNTPPSLSCMCRVSIRESLCDKPCLAVPHLSPCPLPHGISDFLLLGEFEKGRHR